MCMSVKSFCVSLFLYALYCTMHVIVNVHNYISVHVLYICIQQEKTLNSHPLNRICEIVHGRMNASQESLYIHTLPGQHTQITLTQERGSI